LFYLCYAVEIFPKKFDSSTVGIFLFILNYVNKLKKDKTILILKPTPEKPEQAQ